jgi:hypothetical protein
MVAFVGVINQMGTIFHYKTLGLKLLPWNLSYNVTLRANAIETAAISNAPARIELFIVP